MSNFIKITDSNQISRIFESHADKLIVLMFFTKNIPDCRRALLLFEKSASNHITSIFCLVDMDRFDGDSRFTNGVTIMPRFDIYYAGNVIGTINTFGETDIENLVRYGEQNLLTSNNNMRNNGSMNMNNPAMNTQMQQILNNLQMQNPMQFQQMMNSNPQFLQQCVQKQLQQQQMQAFQQPQMMPQMNTFMPQTNPQMGQFNMANNINPVSNSVPSLEQMQQMFQIFKMLQQMGVLNTQVPVTTPSSQEDNSAKDIIVLPNGDKLMPLGNGKYGRIKNKN
jgi:thiol-disulfide isomerase/thioredoxin